MRCDDEKGCLGCLRHLENPFSILLFLGEKYKTYFKPRVEIPLRKKVTKFQTWWFEIPPSSSLPLKTVPLILELFPYSDSDKIWYVDLFWDGISKVYICLPTYPPPPPPWNCALPPWFSTLSHCPIQIKFGMQFNFGMTLLFFFVYSVCNFSLFVMFVYFFLKLQYFVLQTCLLR